MKRYGLVAAALLILVGCASTPQPASVPTAAPEKVPVFVVDGNPAQQKVFSVVLDGVPVLDIGWRYTGAKAGRPGFRFPYDVNMKGRMTMFYEIVYTNRSGQNIRYIEGYSTSKTSFLGPSDGNQLRTKPRVLSRADLGGLISEYDIGLSGKTRSDFYIYGPNDGSRPYSENTYTYYVEGLEKWFAVKYVRGGPDRP